MFQGRQIKVLQYLSLFCTFYRQIVMKEQSELQRLSPLHVDTEFVPSKMHYFTLFNRKVSAIPTVLPYEDNHTIEELEELVSSIHTSNGSAKGSPSKSKDSPTKDTSTIMDVPNCIGDYKKKGCKKRLDGEQIFISQEGSYVIDFGDIFAENKAESQIMERCSISLIMLDRSQEAVHLQFRWKSEQAARAEVAKAINYRYDAELTPWDFKFYMLTAILKKQEDMHFFSFIAQPIESLKEHIFETVHMPFIGVKLQEGKKLPKQQYPSNLSDQDYPPLLQIYLPKQKAIRLNFSMIKHFQVQELLSLLQVQHPESRGLLVAGKILYPKTLLLQVGYLFEKRMVNFINAQLVEQGEVMMKEVEQVPRLNEDELKKIKEESQGLQRRKGEVCPLTLFNSPCRINTKTTSFPFLYHIIHRFIRNYFTHFNSFYDNSISGRFVKTLKQQVNGLPKHKGLTYRRLGYRLDCSKGEILEFNNFIIVSTNKATLQYGALPCYESKYTLLTIMSSQGRVVGEYSSFKGLNEVIFVPFTKFQVTEHSENDDYVSISLRETAVTPRREPSNNILWLQNTDDQARKFFKILKAWPRSISIDFFTNNKALQEWVFFNYKMINSKQAQVIVVTNMRRKENGTDDPNAGIHTIRLVEKLIPSAKVMVYISSISFAKQNLTSNLIDVNSLFLTNDPNELLNKLKAACIPHLLEPPKANTIPNKVETQEWHIYFTNASQQSSIQHSQKQHSQVQPSPFALVDKKDLPPDVQLEPKANKKGIVTVTQSNLKNGKK